MNERIEACIIPAICIACAAVGLLWGSGIMDAFWFSLAVWGGFAAGSAVRL